MRHLKRETGWNIHDNFTIEIKSNSLYDDDNMRHPKNLVDYDKDNYYQSNNESGIFIQFDFKDREIQFTDYSIKSGSDIPNSGHKMAKVGHHLMNTTMMEFIYQKYF